MEPDVAVSMTYICIVTAQEHKALIVQHPIKNLEFT